MNKRSMVVLVGILLSISARAQEVKTVASVDLDRYLGKWHEVARFPNSFQKKCVGDVSAEYSKQEDGHIRVVNRCRVASNQYAEVVGRGRVVAGSGNAKLKVSFMPAWLSWLPIGWGDYWIIGLAPDYSYSVVSDARREYLWILSRTPAMTDGAYKAAMDEAAAQGFQTSKLMKVEHKKQQ